MARWHRDAVLPSSYALVVTRVDPYVGDFQVAIVCQPEPVLAFARQQEVRRPGRAANSALDDFCCLPGGGLISQATLIA